MLAIPVEFSDVNNNLAIFSIEITNDVASEMYSSLKLINHLKRDESIIPLSLTR